MASSGNQHCAYRSLVSRRHVYWSRASASRLYFVLIGCSETRTVSVRLVPDTCTSMRPFTLEWGSFSSVQFMRLNASLGLRFTVSVRYGGMCPRWWFFGGEGAAVRGQKVLYLPVTLRRRLSLSCTVFGDLETRSINLYDIETGVLYNRNI